jgi:hypothetical protein
MHSKLGLDFCLTPIARLRQSQQTQMFRAMALRNVQLSTETVLTHPDLVNLYGCSIGAGTRVGPFVEIQKNSHVGVRWAKVVDDVRDREELLTAATGMAAS